jgi:hypothetical protein
VPPVLDWFPDIGRGFLNVNNKKTLAFENMHATMKRNVNAAQHKLTMAAPGDYVIIDTNAGLNHAVSHINFSPTITRSRGERGGHFIHELKRYVWPHGGAKKR